MITDLIARLVELREKATPGPWSWVKSNGDTVAYLQSGTAARIADVQSFSRGFGPDREERDANAAFIVALVNSFDAIAARLAEVDRYADLGRAAEGNGLAWYNDAGEMLFQAPTEMIAGAAVEAAESLNATLAGRLKEAEGNLDAAHEQLDSYGAPRKMKRKGKMEVLTLTERWEIVADNNFDGG